MPILAEFDGYTLREVTDADLPALKAWVEADRFHDGVLEPEFFLGKTIDSSGELAADPRASCYALEDDAGTIFFIRLSRAARVNIQFAEGKTIRERKRTAEALIKGMAFLEVGLARAGAEQWIFETSDEELARMARARLGFTDSPNELVREIEPSNAPKQQIKTLRMEQQGPRTRSEDGTKAVQ